MYPSAYLARANFKAFLRSLPLVPAASAFFIRMMTTGHLKQRVFFLQHFFFGFRLETFFAFTLPMGVSVA
ncbi:hypothetical protein ASD42_10705 [Nocardia sp. Root136]|nr:hypothetical protein ASD42_10705 [Nocardia sp. Root136]